MEKRKDERVKMFFVYVIVSEERGLRFYVGFSNDDERRLLEHNAGKTKSTKGYRPWKLFYKEEYKNLEEAIRREKYLKSGTGKEQIKEKWFNSGRPSATEDQK